METEYLAINNEKLDNILKNMHGTIVELKKRVSEQDITIDLLKHENESLKKLIENYESKLCASINPYK